MRALILSDIHANLPALEAVLAAAPAHDTVWNLGDIVGYGASPNPVIDRVSVLGHVFVRGNHDRACSGLSSLEDFNAVAAQAAQWTRRALTEDNLEWLRQLPQGPRRVGEGVICVHGSAADEDEYLLSTRDAIEPLYVGGGHLHFFGHTHVQGGFATNGEDWYQFTPDYAAINEAEEYELPLRSGARYLINPGSVGQPRDGDWRSAFAIYDDVAVTVTFFRVPYDVQLAQRLIYEANLPDRLALRLGQGR